MVRGIAVYNALQSGSAITGLALGPVDAASAGAKRTTSEIIAQYLDGAFKRA